MRYGSWSYKFLTFQKKFDSKKCFFFQIFMMQKIFCTFIIEQNTKSWNNLTKFQMKMIFLGSPEVIDVIS